MCKIQAVSRRALACSLVVLLFALTAGAQSALRRNGDKGVKVIANEAQRRVDVSIDGKPFTSYIWPETLKKPVLYPIRTAQGTPVTRGFPLGPRPGERVDHPHHVGLWFNYGDVNGVDFWNNSDGLTPEQQKKMGTIVHRQVKGVKDGKDSGELQVTMDWLMPGGKTVLREDTTFIFYAGPNLRGIDRITRLTALGEPVSFKDNKEGMLGLRVARQLEQPSNKPEVFTDASGKPTAVPKLDNTGVTGLYRSSAGKVGDEVWGTRGGWAALSGKVGEEAVTIAIFDNVRNPGYPTYWHARGYGLFAANPLGQKVFSNGKDELNFALKPKQSVTFKHRILIFSGETTPEKIEAEYQKFNPAGK